MSLACHCAVPKDEADIASTRDLILGRGQRSAYPAWHSCHWQGMRISAKGPFAWDKVEGQSTADLWQGPLETCPLHTERKVMMALPSEGCCDVQVGNADVSI